MSKATKLKISGAPPKRDAVLYLRVQKANKEWLSKHARKSGFKDAATFTDCLLTSLRVETK